MTCSSDGLVDQISWSRQPSDILCRYISIRKLHPFIVILLRGNCYVLVSRLSLPHSDLFGWGSCAKARFSFPNPKIGIVFHWQDTVTNNMLPTHPKPVPT